jgi:hypothetical protein
MGYFFFISDNAGIEPYDSSAFELFIEEVLF